MDQDILEEEAADSGSEVEADAADVVAAPLVCLACGAMAVGAYCSSCGQKNDDLRRSSFVLAKDFLRDTFGFDSRMWRTLGLMAAAPGLVPSNYAHGKRSRYTPPVRLFLVVSFLFFLTLGLTQTLFIAFEVTPKSAEQIAAERAAIAQAAAAAETVSGDVATVLGNGNSCDANLRLRSFIRREQVTVDEAAWAACAERIRQTANLEINLGDSPDAGLVAADDSFDRMLAGLSAAIEKPNEFNSRVNAWLPRIMLGMTPVLALLLALFIRGRDALLFDHLILSLYSHAVGFAIIGAAIVAGQFGVAYAGTAAMAALGLYFLLALKRAYSRGWIKTVFTASFVALFYFITLSGVVAAIVMNAIWRAA